MMDSKSFKLKYKVDKFLKLSKGSDISFTIHDEDILSKDMFLIHISLHYDKSDKYSISREDAVEYFYRLAADFGVACPKVRSVGNISSVMSGLNAGRRLYCSPNQKDFVKELGNSILLKKQFSHLSKEYMWVTCDETSDESSEVSQEELAGS